MKGAGEHRGFGTNSDQRDADDFYAELRDADMHDKAHARTLRELALSGGVLLVVERQYAEEAEEDTPTTLLRIIEEEEVA